MVVTEELVKRACAAYDANRDAGGDDYPSEYPAMWHALTAALESMWRPIEDNTKDEVAVLGWLPKSRCAFTMTWDDDWGAWRCFGGSSGFHGEKPTHYMPLPAPPVQQKEGV